ncbi:hypothetical protein PV10_04497 [Exophiala mesophila]|uniref:SNF7 family protein n=1 Tax=Exophiala mesophila TaxID=212818 RepID=A0A0D1XYD9_EXOME|nr:uncharacterized protein PV10_04497 [Exophiala mesophila]KIV93271.1 hypothetical protein PV10_04497 [Exophiala mesophila]
MSPSALEWLIQHEPSFRKTRLPSLYSDLGVQKNSNPEGFSANVTAWTSALTRLALAGQLPPEQSHFVIQTSDDLLSALSSPIYGQPSGLGYVIDEAVRHGKMIEQKDFMASEKSIYHRSWIPSPWAIMKWGLRQAGIVGSGSYEASSGRLRSGDLVVVPALEELARHVSAMIKERGLHSLTDRITSRESFVRDLNSTLEKNTPIRLSEQDLKLVLRYLSRDKNLLTYDSHTIKFHLPTTSSPDPITHEDRSIATLKDLITSLTNQTTSLDSRIATLQSTAQNAVKQGNKTSALSALRSKKLAESTLEGRLSTLHQLEQVYTRIEDAVDQVQIISVMESSAGVLKSLNKKIGGVERVDDVLESLRTEMEKVDEVSGVISEPLDGGKAAIGEEEVDEEFEEMEREEKAKREEIAAEATRKRLAELEDLERERKKQQQQQQKQPPEKYQVDAQDHTQTQSQIEDAALEEELSRSADKLKTLDLNMDLDSKMRSRSVEGMEQGQENDPRQTSGERIPETAS